MSRLKEVFMSYLRGDTGLLVTRPFLVMAMWWPILIIVLLGRFFYFGDRRPLGESEIIWQLGRGIIVTLAIIALFRLREPRWREWIGLSFLGYSAAASVSYYNAIDVRDKLFWGDIIGLVSTSLLIFTLAIVSVIVLHRDRARRIFEASDDDLDQVI